MVLTDIDGNLVEVVHTDVKNVLCVDNVLTGETEEDLTGIIMQDGSELIVHGERGDVMKNLILEGLT